MHITQMSLCQLKLYKLASNKGICYYSKGKEELVVIHFLSLLDDIFKQISISESYLCKDSMVLIFWMEESHLSPRCV